MAHRESLVQDMFRTMHDTLALFDAPEAALNRAYAPGKWTLREILIHLSDTEAVYLDRARRIIADEKPMLLGFDQDRWAQQLFYKTRDLSLARIQFEAARRSLIELARTVEPKLDASVGIHSEAGPKTLAQIFKTMPDHVEHHLEHARAIVDGKTWAPKK
jgi:hypothetical protein